MNRKFPRRRLAAGLLATAGMAGIALASDWFTALPDDAVASYIGGARCADCHQEQFTKWSGSDHDRAMEIATAESVLGDFDDAEFTYQGVTSRMYRKDGKYFIHTEGPDGELHDYEIKYTFGITPLQQYMVEFPDGRVQVLRVSWDAIDEKWFYVTPPDVTDERILPGDPLHWTGVAQNWNHTCAECHSTNLQKHYDLATDTYHTTFSEIDVSCEACHGPGSLHVELAESRSLFWDRKRGYAIESFKEKKSTRQIETCAACHSRRFAVHPQFRPGEPFLDEFEPALLTEGLYHADGQILDEVYVYGSFLQSKMHAENVKCSDCHDSHSLKLRFEGNALCGQCHTPGKYDAPSHHHHEPDTPGAMCVNCHMRSQVYMGIDERRDHSFRVPRPDLTESIGTPNACADCHEEPASWAAEKVRAWYGDKRADDPHYAPALAAGRSNAEGADELLADVVARPRADIARATAVQMLGGYGSERSQKTRIKALDDASPLVRLAAVRAFPSAGPDETVAQLAPLLNDSSRAVRSAAARRLAELPLEYFAPRQREALASALAEYREAQSLALDRAASHMNLGNLVQLEGDVDEAIDEFRTAIEMESYLTGPRSSLVAALEEKANALIQLGQSTRDAEKIAACKCSSARSPICVVKKPRIWCATLS